MKKVYVHDLIYNVIFRMKETENNTKNALHCNDYLLSYLDQNTCVRVFIHNTWYIFVHWKWTVSIRVIFLHDYRCSVGNISTRLAVSIPPITFILLSLTADYRIDAFREHARRVNCSDWLASNTWSAQIFWCSICTETFVHMLNCWIKIYV